MNVLQRIEKTLIEEIAKAAVKAGLVAEAELQEVVLEKPKEKAHGDFATNLAMRLARIAKKAPKQIAADIVPHFDAAASWVHKVEIAGPGFINFFMMSDYIRDVLTAILEDKKDYGKTN